MIKPTYFGNSQYLAVAHARRYGRKVVWSPCERDGQEAGYRTVAYGDELADGDVVVYDHSKWKQLRDGAAQVRT